MREDQIDTIKNQICMHTLCSKCLFNEDGRCWQEYANTTLIFKMMAKIADGQYFKEFFRVSLK